MTQFLLGCAIVLTVTALITALGIWVVLRRAEELQA